MSADDVVLTGQLVCVDEEQAALVRTYLPEHVELSRAETGCLDFSVTPTDDPLVWDVSERFADPEAFAAHRERVRTSDWGLRTAGIERRYTLDGVDAPD